MKVLSRLTTTAAVPLHRISTFSVGNDNDDIRINLYYDHKEDTLECYCVGSLASKIFKKNSSTPLFSVKDSKEANKLFREAVGKILNYIKAIYGVR